MAAYKLMHFGKNQVTEKMIPIFLLVFHLVQAFGTAKGFFNLKLSKTVASLSISWHFNAAMNFDKAIWLL